MSRTYLFSLTITPVQSFISQARKTKDLFAGSEILSSLIRKVLENFDKNEIIFPQNREFVSNKFVARLENKSQKEIEDIGKDLEDNINQDYINKIFQITKKCDNNLQNFFQVFWVAVELEDDYLKSYKKLEQNLGAVKNLRTFTQQRQSEGKEKCSICGERNVEERDRDDKLCLICYTKRVCPLQANNSYPSIAKIALLDWLKGVNYHELKNIKNFDEELFFDDNLNSKYLKKVEVPSNAITKIKKFIKENNLDTSKQKKYYALIQFDIDDMGKKLSNLDEENQINLSKQLGEFAQEAKKIVDERGKTIYAGGDDFLGFVNLAYLFEVIKEIKSSFDIKGLTYSTSIIIAHYKSPLHKVLEFSRDLLDKTKSHFDNKNGVGIIVLSDSAINAQTICRYDDLKLLETMKNQKVGMNLHYKLDRVFNYLDRMSFDEFLTQKEMIKVEIKRLLKREEGDFNQNIYNELIDFFERQKIEYDTNDYQIDFDNFIGYLKTLEQLKRVS